MSPPVLAILLRTFSHEPIADRKFPRLKLDRSRAAATLPTIQIEKLRHRSLTFADQLIGASPADPGFLAGLKSLMQETRESLEICYPVFRDAEGDFSLARQFLKISRHDRRRSHRRATASATIKHEPNESAFGTVLKSTSEYEYNAMRP